MFTRRYLVTLATLSLLVLLIASLAVACDDDDEGVTVTVTETATATATAASTTTAVAPPTTAETSGEPVKIGVLSSWTGAVAMAGMFFADPSIKTVEKQIEEMGGILGGRPVEFVKYDTGGQVSEATAGARKLITKDHVSALAIGGSAPAEFYGVARVAEEERVLYSCVSSITDLENFEYTVEANMSTQALVDDVAKFMLEVATPRPDTVGFMTFSEVESHDLVERWKDRLEPEGIETVYEEYLTHDISDLSPYLTKLKRAEPDYFIASVDSVQFQSIAKQIMEQGGWGDIKVISFGTASAAVKMPGAQGWIMITSWHPLKDDPASVKFKEDFEAVNGQTPSDLHVYFYNSLWTAIHAIELAGTDDPEDVARAARSGNLEFDTPMGMVHMTTEGHSGLRNIYLQIQDGEMVPFSQ